MIQDFSYTPGGSTNIDRVRLEAGDTNQAETKLSDTEITGLVNTHGSWQGAVAAIYWRRHGDLSRVASSVSNAEGSTDYGATLTALQAQARRWDQLAAAATTTPSDLPLAVVGNMGPYAGSPCRRY